MRYTTKMIDELKAEDKSAIAIGPFGSRMKSDCYVLEGIPVIRGNNLSDTIEFKGDFVFITQDLANQLVSSSVYAGDLVFPHRGAIGEVGIIPLDDSNRYVLSTSLMKLTCDRGQVDPVFLFYFFRSKYGKHELLKNASQVGTPGISTPLTSLKEIEVPLPELGVQEAIAEILSSLDKKIELNRKQNRTLEAVAQALFKRWFVEFEFPDENGQPYKSSGGAMQLSEMGEIEHVPLSDPIEVNPRHSIKNGWHTVYVDMKALPTIGMSVSDVMNKPFTAGSKFQLNDILLARITPCLENGKTAFVDFLGKGQIAFGSTEFIVMRGREEVSPQFVYCLARDPLFRQYAIKSMVGSSGRQRVQVDQIKKFPVPFPSNNLMMRFDEVTKPLFKKISGNRLEIITLSNLRDTLLPKLMSGELRVGDAPALMEATA